LDLCVPHPFHDAPQVGAFGEEPGGVGVTEVVHADGEVDAGGCDGGEPDAGSEGVAGDRGSGGGGEEQLVAADAVGLDVEGDGFEPVVLVAAPTAGPRVMASRTKVVREPGVEDLAWSRRALTLAINRRYLSVMRSDGPALLPVFRSQHQAELLMWLMLHPDQEFGVSDLAARLGVPLSTLHREVVRLDEAGLISSRTLGRNRLLRANVTHPAAQPLTQLLEVTFGPKVVVAEEFAIPGAEKVLIFGSWAARYAGQTGPPPHDIDVLVVGKVDRADLYDAADRSHARLGIEVNPVVRTVEQWTDPADALVAQIKASAFTVVLDTADRVGA
jgi:DNA-binding transcriptional ArsR family regulator